MTLDEKQVTNVQINDVIFLALSPLIGKSKTTNIALLWLKLYSYPNWKAAAERIFSLYNRKFYCR
jgi:hypothetical protein